MKNVEKWQRSSASVPAPTSGRALIPWIGVGILLLCGSSCSSRNGPLVQLHPEPLDPATTQVSLLVTATDPTGRSAASPPFPFTSGPFQPLGVTFPVGTRGLSTYQVNAYNRLGCNLAIGDAFLNLVSDDVFDLPVMMKVPPLGGPAAMLSLVAGGLGGLGNADGSGPDARFNFPLSVAADGAGNLYVADPLNHTIRKVVVGSGKVTTVAGTAGMSGSTDGVGPAARFRFPAGVTIDVAGNLYVADRGNSTIRKVIVTSGEVTTVAGTAGMSGSNDAAGSFARFRYPTGVAVDSTGNLYVADYSNSTIRKVVVATGDVTTVAGTAGMNGSIDGTGSVARFNYPTGVAVDGMGNLYVADSANHTIRVVVPGSGKVTTLAGTAGMSGSTDASGLAARFNYPTGVAVDGAGNLFVADYSNNTIRKVVVATGVVTTLAGTAGVYGSMDGIGTAARFNRPHGMAMDGAGNLFVADERNQTIRKVIVATGAVTTLAGTASMYGSTDSTGAAARFYSPNGVAADGAGSLYVADSGNSTIRKVAMATGAVTTLAGTAGMSGINDGIGADARFYYPSGVAVDGAGNLFVADAVNRTIRKVVVATGAVTTLAGTAGMRGSADGTGADARFNYPSGVAADDAGNLYVADQGNSTIRKVVVATGVVTTLAGTADMTGSADGTGPAARFNTPTGVAMDSTGNLYVADYSNSTIRKVVVATGAVTTLAGTAGMSGSTDGTGPAARFNTPQGVAVDGACNLYVADTSNGTVRQIRLSTGSVTTIVGVAGQLKVQIGLLPAGLNQPKAVATLPNNQLIILNEDSVLLAR